MSVSLIKKKAAVERMALYLPSLVGGGAERVMVNLANGIAELGVPVDLVLAEAKGPYLKQVSSQVRLINLKAGRVLTSIPGLARYLRRERPAALISALNHANVIAILAKKLAGVKTRVLVSEHSIFRQNLDDQPDLDQKNKLLALSMRLFYPLADRVIAVSRGVAEDIQAVAKLAKGPLVIYNPVLSAELYKKAEAPLTHPWFKADEPPVILAVGRLEPVKDFANLIHAFAVLRQQKQARLVILGEGDERSKLEALIASLDLQEAVALPGFVDNPYPYMKKAHLFVLSSQREGLPTVLIEALSLGTPVVATDCRSGPREILADGEYGELVPIQDPSALAKAMLNTLIMPQQRISQDVLYPYTKEAAIAAYLAAAGLSLGVVEGS